MMAPSDVMTVAAMSAAVVMAALLLRAGVEKSADLPATASTIAALGIPAEWAHRAAGVMALVEVGTALGVLFAPGSGWTLAAVAALAGAFALAGLVAVLRKSRIRCNCFGSGAAGAYLGRAQILALPAWIGGALLLHYGHPETLPLASGALLLAAAGLATATLKVAALWQAVREARGDRVSAQEMYLWLPPR
jgi:hypothetical protein